MASSDEYIYIINIGLATCTSCGFTFWTAPFSASLCTSACQLESWLSPDLLIVFLQTCQCGRGSWYPWIVVNIHWSCVSLTQFVAEKAALPPTDLVTFCQSNIKSNCWVLNNEWVGENFPNFPEGWEVKGPEWGAGVCRMPVLKVVGWHNLTEGGIGFYFNFWLCSKEAFTAIRN